MNQDKGRGFFLFSLPLPGQRKRETRSDVLVKLCTTQREEEEEEEGGVRGKGGRGVTAMEGQRECEKERRVRWVSATIASLKSD